MPINRIAYVDQPFAGRRYTPDTSRLSGLYTGMGDMLAASRMQQAQSNQRALLVLGQLFSRYQDTKREQAEATAGAARRQSERLEDKAFTAEQGTLERTARAQEREQERADRAAERKADAEARVAEKAEAAVAEDIDKAPRGIVSPALFEAAKKFPNQAARFITADGVAMNPMTGPERQAFSRDQKIEADRQADNARMQAQIDEAARHNRATEAAAAAAANDKTSLTDAGVDMAALNYRKTGVMPPLGMGDKGTRQRIINRAAELRPADMARIEAVADIAGAKQDYAANSASLNALQKSRDAIGAFEQTAQKNINVFLDTAGKVVDTGSPLANQVARKVSGALLGSPDQAAYEAARQVAINEVAKITSNPTLSGQLSDSARHEVAAFSPENATLAQTVKVMRLLQLEMQNRTTALDTELAAVRGRGKTAAPAAPPAGAGAVTMRFNPATGKLESVRP